METSVWIALIGMGSLFITSLASPVVVFLVQSRAARKQKLEDYARQDAVAARDAEYKIRLLDGQKRAAELLLAGNERVAESTKITNEKLDTIHTLVNSNMTAAMQSELDATVRELAMMAEVIDLKKAAGHGPSEEALAAMETTRKKIAELHATISDRVKV